MICKVFSRIHLIVCQILISCWFLVSLSTFGFESSPSVTNVTDKYIVGHYRNNPLRSSIYEIDDIPAERLTHLIYQSAHLTEQGTVELADRFIDVQKLYIDLDVEKSAYAGNFAKLAQLKKKYPNLKILISIGAWGQSNLYRSLTKTASQRSKLATACIDFMEQYGFDGIDIYWQPYEEEIPDTNKFLEDRKQFSLLMAELYKELKSRDNDALLSAIFKIPAIIHDWPVENIAAHVDFLNLSATYFHGAWENKTDHIAPLFAEAGRPSVDTVIQSFTKHKFPLKKIILDIGTYGQGWQGISDVNNGLYQPAQTASLGSWDLARNTGLYSQDHVQQLIHLSGYTVYWDNHAKVSYAFNPIRLSGHFISFEDIKSITEKITYLKAKGLAGIGILDLHNEKNQKNSLLNHIHRQLYFWKEIKLITIELIERHSDDLIYLIKSIALLIVCIGLLLYYRARKIKDKLRLQAENESNKNNLLKLEWSLIQLAYLFSFTKKLPWSAEISALANPATQLLHAVTGITSKSKVRYGNKEVINETVCLKTVVNSAKMMITSTMKDVSITTEIEEDITIDSDFMLLTQLIIRICQGLLASQKSASITIKSFNSGNTAELVFVTNDGQQLPSNDYYSLREAFSSASTLGLQLTFNEHSNNGFSLSVPKIANTPYRAAQQINNQSITRSAPPVTANSQFTEHFSRFNNLIKNEIEKVDFRKDSTPLIEIACNAFLDIHQNISIQVNQADQHLLSVGEKAVENQIETTLSNEDLSFKIQSTVALSENDVMVFELLINQIQSIRKALKGITRNSKFLEELHYLSAEHENLLYLQADEGYTFAYREDQKSPKILSMRLRSIKYFFDDQDYLPIHRSCLVNPSKVKQVLQPHKLKYEVDILAKRLPLSRNYVAQLKVKYPHWFQQV